MELTTKYSLKKPQVTDVVDITDFNDNADIIDATLKAHAEPTFEDFTGNTTVPNTETALAAIKSKATLGALFSNIKAFLSGAVTKSQIVNNLLATTTGNVLDATQGKALNDKIVALNSNLMVEDVSSKITAINGVVITSKVAKRVQSLCYISFGVLVPADSLFNLSIFSLDSSLHASIGLEGVAVNTITGVAYAMSVASTIRFSAVQTNNNYTKNTEIKCQLTWFVK